jgi:hypothetical protein
MITKKEPGKPTIPLVIGCKNWYYLFSTFSLLHDSVGLLKKHVKELTQDFPIVWMGTWWVLQY